ncbi:MAG: hypothetical protein ABR588_00155 [Sphingomicrobium sp.]
MTAADATQEMSSEEPGNSPSQAPSSAHGQSGSDDISIPPPALADDHADSAAPTSQPVDTVATDVGSLQPPPATEAPSTEPTSVETDDLSDWSSAGYDSGEVAPVRGKGPLILLLLVLFVAALAAAAWFVAPREWLARAGLREAATDSPLKLMVTSQDRQKLASGNDLVSLSGRVINPTEQTLTVPPLQADLRDGGGKLVYSWTIAPPASRLPPRGSASFNAAELGVPPNATSLTLRWAG